ncbi:MAG: uncharacterized protein KVP18_000017 [Porospora cf. gigantea A]|uniref:uncharacterized protein n=1 Tax=Porospora cf. gigantea A TaxID=2853593 RepID=UPI00355A3B70|nr:MAG: hypothetical protein KVP18_000017 [Porospora cf. gigantea A]
MWDLEAEEAVATVWESKEREYPQSVDFNYAGDMIVVATRERRLALVDPRALGTVTTAKAHVGPKGMRVCWTEGLAGKEKSLTTVGFDRKAQRELKFWDARMLSDCVFSHPLHSGTRLPMCVWDDAVGVLVASGRGENVAKFFGMGADSFTSVMKDYRAPTPHHSFCFLPKHSVNVSKNEVLRLFRHDAKGTIQPVSFAPVGRTDRVPIPELYRHGANVPAAAQTSSAWRAGEDALPLRKDIFRDATGIPVVIALGESPASTKDPTDTATGSAASSPRTQTQEPDHSTIPSLHELLNEKPPQCSRAQSRVPELDFAKVRDRALQRSKGAPVFTVDGLTPHELGQVSVGSASLDWSYSQERYVARLRSSQSTPPPVSYCSNTEQTPPAMKAKIRVSSPTTDTTEAIPAPVGGPNDDKDTEFHAAAETTLPEGSLTGVAEMKSAVSETAESLKRQIESLNSSIQGAKLSAGALMDYIDKCEGDLDALIDQKTRIDKLLAAFAVTPLSPV